MSEICKRCVMNNVNTDITFNEEGFCNYCTEAMEMKTHVWHNDDNGKKELENFINETLFFFCNNYYLVNILTFLKCKQCMNDKRLPANLKHLLGFAPTDACSASTGEYNCTDKRLLADSGIRNFFYLFKPLCHSSFLICNKRNKLQ